MRKRRSTKVAKLPKTTLSVDHLAQALTKRRKAELVDVIVEIARADRTIMRRLEARFAVHVSPEGLIAATREAIADATDFDERDINYNFSYDFEAYNAVKRNFGRLIFNTHKSSPGFSQNYLIHRLHSCL